MRKKNGEEYEPSSLRAFIQSIDWHLRKNNYGFSVLNDKEFHEVQDKQKQLKSIGKENRPNAADPLSDEDIDTFYSRKVLKDKQKRVPAKAFEILERRNVKCTKTRVTQIAAPSTPTWLTKSTDPQA